MMKRKKKSKVNIKLISCVLLFILIQQCTSDNTCFGNQEDMNQEDMNQEDMNQEDMNQEDMNQEDMNQEDIYQYFTLAKNERVVKSYEELNDALSKDNGIDTVYLSNNITMELTGIRIHPNKKNITIDGMNPLNKDQTEPYTLTDYSSAAFTDTIYVNAVGPENIHIRNLKIVGKNFYGPFSILDAANLSNVVMTYENVDYNGPQIGYHRNGLIRFINCTVNIHGRNGGSVNQEFSEAKHLVFEGINTIDTETDMYSVFWHPFGGSFRLLKNSKLYLTSPDTSASFGIFYADAYNNKIDITIAENAGFYASINDVLAPVAYSTINSLMVQESAAFHLIATGSPNEPIISMGGDLTVSTNAAFIIKGDGSTSYAVVNQLKGDIIIEKDATFHIITSGNYKMLMNLHGNAFTCNQPASVLLYSTGRDIEATGSISDIYINAQQINYWNVISKGGLDEPPVYSFRKNDKTNFWIKGELATGENGNFTGLLSNYSIDDLPVIKPSKETFNMVDARVLAFGNLVLIVNEPPEKSSKISGITAPGADIRVSFHQNGIDYILPDIRANEEGLFQIDLGVPIEEYTVITVKSSKQYLTTETKVKINERRILEFVVPDKIDFLNTKISITEKYAKRLYSDWKIIVSDTRGAGGGWKLYARLLQPLMPSDITKPVLSDALVFVDNNTTPLTPDGMLIHHHISTSDNEINTVQWAEDKGILIQVPINAVYAGTKYTAIIEWTLVDAP